MLTLASAAALVMRRQWPVGVFAVTLAAMARTASPAPRGISPARGLGARISPAWARGSVAAMSLGFGRVVQVGTAPPGARTAALRVRPLASRRVEFAPEKALIDVVIADDQALVRAGFRLLLETEDDIRVLGEARDGREAVGLAHRHRPDVVLMDIRMPELDGLAATREIAAAPELDGVKVLILTTFETDEYVFESLRAGASGFVLKDTEPAELVRALRVVAGGDALLSPKVTRRLIAEFVARPAQERAVPPALDELTEREREVMSLVARGLNNGEIAERLVVSPATAKTHVGRAMMKLHAHDRAQLVVLAYESGLVAPGAA